MNVLMTKIGNTCQQLTAIKEEKNMIKLREEKEREADNLICLSIPWK